MLLSFPRSSSSSVCTGVPLVCCAARGCAPTRRLTTRPLGTAGMCAYVFALHRWLGLSLRRTSCRTRCHGWLAQSSRCCSLCHRKTGTGTPSSLSRRIRLWPEIGCHNACGDLLGQNAHCCWRQPHKTGTCSGMCRPSSLGDRTREATCAGRPRHLPLARALRGLRLRPFPVTPSRQVLPARSSLPSVRLLPLFRVGRPQQWIARAPSGGGAANAARVGSLCERRDKPTPMTRTCCIVACHSVRARAACHAENSARGLRSSQWLHAQWSRIFVAHVRHHRLSVFRAFHAAAPKSAVLVWRRRRLWGFWRQGDSSDS